VSIHSSKFARSLARAALAVLAVLPFATANAEFLRVTGANAINNSVYDVTFPSPPMNPPTVGTTTPLNTDGGHHGSFSALVHVVNATGTVDVLAADAQSGQIIRYTQGSTSGTVVWSYTGSGSGPAHPDGLSVDPAGNLYAVTSKNHDGTKSAVWVFPVATGYAAPLLIDTASFSANGVTVPQETAVATSTTAAWGVGDLLVLVGSKTFPLQGNGAELLVYRANSIASVLSGAGPRTAPDAVLISGSQFPTSEFPVGMDFWPADALIAHPTLLIATTAGRILRWDFTNTNGVLVPSIVKYFANTQPTDFASNLGTGLQKLKVGLQLGVQYAFATQAPTTQNGQILQLGAPSTAGTTNLVGSATGGVVDPDGLAVTRFNSAPATSCVTPPGSPPPPPGSPPSGCDISQGVDPHQITLTTNTTLTGNVTEQTCVFLVDPRYYDANGNLTDTCNPNTELDLSTYCQGYKVSIPGSTCGGSGISKKGFAVIRTVANGVDNLPGNPLLVATQNGVDSILPPPPSPPPPAPPNTNPGCTKFTPPFSPVSVVIWAPNQFANPSEGNIVEAVGDPLGLTPLTDITGACDNSTGFQRGASYYGIGLIYNAAALSGQLQAFAVTKGNNLSTTVTNAITSQAITGLAASTLPTALSQVNALIAQGTQNSLACAANQIVTLDGTVANDPGDFPGNDTTKVPGGNPNPWGEVRGRLANLYFAINTLLLKQTSNTQWPPLAGTDTVPVCPLAQISTLTAGPTPPAANLLSGGSPTLTWSTSNATSCSFTAPAGFNASGLSGVVMAPAINAPTIYTLTCLNPLGQATSQSVTAVPVPNITFKVSPSSVISGSSPKISISWTSDAMACVIKATDGFNVSGGNSGSATDAPMNVISPITYTLSCANSDATGTVTATATTTASVTVLQPVTNVTLKASPSSVGYKGVSTLTWSESSATSCAITGKTGKTNISPIPITVSSSVTTGSVMTAPLLCSTTFTLTCTNSVNTATATTQVFAKDRDGDYDCDD
jgi:hypothetical protein